MGSVITEITRAIPHSDIFAPALPLGALSTTDPENIASELIEQIDAVWRAPEAAYDKLVFVGHSVGALLARMTYLLARERYNEGDRARTGWTDHMDRIVLMAGMNRGWLIGHQLGPVKQLGWTVGTALAKAFQWVSRRRLLIMSIRRGSPFITNLRVRWIRLGNRKGETLPLTVQLLGSIDDMVAPSDNIDMVAGRNFVYLDMPYSGHASIVDLHSPIWVKSADGDWVTQGAKKRVVFRQALLCTAKKLQADPVHPSDHAPVQKNLDVDHVVFVIHGIRDAGHWTKKIARRIQSVSAKEKPGVVVKSETSSYGFFPMLPFMMPGARAQKVAWFMDQYAETLATYPNAKISFVGHSHGTYLLARALELYPYCKFENVILAGSVIRSNYPWKSKIGTQVGRVMNFVASGDWVVAFFPKAFELLKLQDLGSGGHDGFTDIGDDNLRYIEGAHSAALVEDNWDNIANFVVSGVPITVPPMLSSGGQSWAVKHVAKVAWLVWLLLGAAAVWVGVTLWHWSGPGPWFGLPGWGAGAQMLVLILYIWGLLTAVTKL